MTPAEDPRTAPSHEAAIPAALAEENARLRAGNAALEETIAVLLARVAELERRLNSSNSGKPPTGCTSPGGSRVRAVCASGPANRPAGRRRRDLAPGRRSERHHRSLPRDLWDLRFGADDGHAVQRAPGVRSARAAAVDRHRASGVSLPLRPVRRGNPGAVSRGGHGAGAIWPAPPGGLPA